MDNIAVQASPETTMELAIETGGWYWFAGWIEIAGHGPKAEATVIFLPERKLNSDPPIIPFPAYWITSSDVISGRWWGPIEPPAEFYAE